MIRSAAGFTVTGQVKDMFFDRMRVMQRISAENRRKLSRAGAFVRQRAMTSMRRAPKSKRSLYPPSRPGNPPNVHSRDSFATLRNILFFLNKDWESVIVGPRGIPSLQIPSPRKTVPALMEFGGSAMISEILVDGEWVLGRSKDTEVPQRKRSARYPARPFMGPALKAEVAAGTIPDIWKRRGA